MHREPFRTVRLICRMRIAGFDAMQFGWTCMEGDDGVPADVMLSPSSTSCNCFSLKYGPGSSSGNSRTIQSVHVVAYMEP